MIARSIYKIEAVKNIYSGDDLILMLDLGHDGLYRLTRCRLLGVDAPSTFNSDNKEATELKKFVSRAINNSKDAYVEVNTCLNNSWLVILYVLDPKTNSYTSLNSILINSGYVYTKRTTDAK